MDAKTRYKAKKIKIVFFDIDDTLRNVETGYVPASITRVFSQLREKGIYTAIASGRGILECQKKSRLSNRTSMSL